MPVVFPPCVLMMCCVDGGLAVLWSKDIASYIWLNVHNDRIMIINFNYDNQ